MSDVSHLRKLMSSVDKPKRIVAIYPGRFQPFHLGHAAVYNIAKEKYGECYIATSGSLDIKSPFTSEHKRIMMMRSGIPIDKIAVCRQPYMPIEILQNFNPQYDSVVFFIGEKDMASDPRFQFKPTKSGKPSYFQPWVNDDTLDTFNNQGYIRVVPTIDFTVNGQLMRSASEFRSMFAKADNAAQTVMVTDMYGVYDGQIHNIMKNRLT